MHTMAMYANPQDAAAGGLVDQRYRTPDHPLEEHDQDLVPEADRSEMTYRRVATPKKLGLCEVWLRAALAGLRGASGARALYAAEAVHAALGAGLSRQLRPSHGTRPALACGPGRGMWAIQPHSRRTGGVWRGNSIWDAALDKNSKIARPGMEFHLALSR
jgi:hypothetical protein